MNGYQQLKKQLLPIMSGAPWMIAIFVLALFLGRMIVRYTSEKYQSTAKIKLDDQKFGFSSNFIYKDFSMFSLEHRIEAEVELIKSPLIISKAVDSLKLSTEIIEIGSVKKTTRYEKLPFDVRFARNETERSEKYLLEIQEKGNFLISNEAIQKQGMFGAPVELEGDTLWINPTQKITHGTFEIRQLSKQDIVNRITTKIDVKAPDKETPIIRITYSDGDPKRASDIVNAICEAYITDYVETKSSAASRTVSFIDKQLSDIGSKLKSSERNLERFKIANDVVNTRQETETGLREISQLRVDMINLEISERAMKDLQSYIDEGSYFDETALNFGFGDLVLTELVKKLKMLIDERADTQMKYTEESPEIQVIDEKVANIKKYIKEAINRNFEDLKTRQEKLSQSYEIQRHMFDELPTREKEQRVLERNFMINESVYNFLSKKKIDASILANSMISFHRIIQPGLVAEEPMSPNRTLIKFMSGLIGLIGGVGFIYLRRLTSAKITSREDIEKNSMLPFVGIVRKEEAEYDCRTLFKSLQIKYDLKPGAIIGITSANRGEGKRHLGRNLFQTILASGHTCALVQFDASEKSNDGVYLLDRMTNTLENQVQEIALSYDFTIIVAPPTTHDILAVNVMSLSSFSLFLFRANYTGMTYVQEADCLVDEYNLQNVGLVLNGAHRATNYNGNYVGSRFTQQKEGKLSLKRRLKNYYKIYVK